MADSPADGGASRGLSTAGGLIDERPSGAPEHPYAPPVTERAAPSSRSHPRAGIAMLMIVGGGFATQLLTTVTGVLSARMLGVEGRGQIVLVASLAALASQLTLGGSLPNAITKTLAERGVTARDGLSHLVGRWTLYGLAAAAVAGVYLVFLERHTAGATKYALGVAVLIIALQNIASRILTGSMLGEGADLVHVAMTSVLPQAFVTLVLTVAFAVGIRWNAVELSAVTISCVMIVLLSRLRLLKTPARRTQDRIDGRELYLLARRTHIGSVGPIDGLSIDRTLVGSLLGSVQLGLYSVAFALAGLTTILGACLAMVILPRVTIAQRNPRTEKYLVRSWLLLSAVVIAGAVIGLEFMIDGVIRVAFGKEFIAASACAHWLVAASGLLDFRRVMIAILQGRGRGAQASVIELALTPFVVGGIVVAAAKDSLVGVGVTMGVVGLLSCIALGVAVSRSAPAFRYVAAHSLARQG
jgi:O-antigen/teichoic acid export membrane protein